MFVLGSSLFTTHKKNSAFTLLRILMPLIRGTFVFLPYFSLYILPEFLLTIILCYVSCYINYIKSIPLPAILSCDVFPTRIKTRAFFPTHPPYPLLIFRRMHLKRRILIFTCSFM